ncbi:MAG: hypothetical protein IKB82_03740 [Clostridia bacterium]|nr:hypothetical protein [Clostridia bacterium]
MKQSKHAWLAAGLLALAAALAGCSIGGTPAASSTPNTANKITAQPNGSDSTLTPDESPQTDAQETPGPIALKVEETDVAPGALLEGDLLYLPLVETAEAFGWEAESETAQEESLTRRSVALSSEESRITVSWVVSDNTAKQITWQKDGLLIPVNTELTSVQGIVYVPAAFFEMAMDARIERMPETVIVTAPKTKETPANDADEAGKSEVKEESENG